MAATKTMKRTPPTVWGVVDELERLLEAVVPFLEIELLESFLTEPCLKAAVSLCREYRAAEAQKQGVRSC